MTSSRSQLGVFMAGLAETPAHHLSVDGMTAEGPNLSHWPGNRTPREWRADLSTGICARFVRAPQEAQETFLGDVEAVVNDHYDTDGFLSMLTIVRPEVALAREEVCLLAAATGDYQAFQTERTFAIDRIVLGLARSDQSPLRRDLQGLSPKQRDQFCYRWLIDNAEQVLDEPTAFAELYEEELAEVYTDFDTLQRGKIEQKYHTDAELAVVRSVRPLSRIVLNTCAGAFRVLHMIVGPGGTHVRYHDRTESWFEVVTFTPPRRRDLTPLCEVLQQLEEGTGAHGALSGEWCVDPHTDPVPELYYGVHEPQEYGQVTRSLTPSRLRPEVIEEAFAAFFS